MPEGNENEKPGVPVEVSPFLQEVSQIERDTKEEIPDSTTPSVDLAEEGPAGHQEVTSARDLGRVSELILGGCRRRG